MKFDVPLLKVFHIRLWSQKILKSAKYVLVRQKQLSRQKLL